MSGASKIAVRDLESLLVVVEEQHFPRAAARLGMTETALARSIRRLESELDLVLVRHGGGVATPTDAGHRFAEHVRPLLCGLRLAAVEARRAPDVFTAVRMGCVPDLPVQHLQGFVGGLRTWRPELDVDVAYLRTAEQLRRLRSGALDLGLIHQVGETRGITIEVLFVGEALWAYLPLGHRLAAAPALRAGDLEDEVLLVTAREADPAVQDRVEALLADAGHGFRRVRPITGEDERSLLLAVAHQQGVVIAPRSLGFQLGEIMSLVVSRPLEPEVRMPDTALAWQAQPPGDLHTIVSAARRLAATLYAEQRDPG